MRLKTAAIPSGIGVSLRVRPAEHFGRLRALEARARDSAGKLLPVIAAAGRLAMARQGKVDRQLGRLDGRNRRAASAPALIAGSDRIVRSARATIAKIKPAVPAGHLGETVVSKSAARVLPEMTLRALIARTRGPEATLIARSVSQVYAASGRPGDRTIGETALTASLEPRVIGQSVSLESAVIGPSAGLVSEAIGRTRIPERRVIGQSVSPGNAVIGRSVSRRRGVSGRTRSPAPRVIGRCGAKASAAVLPESPAIAATHRFEVLGSVAIGRTAIVPTAVGAVQVRATTGAKFGVTAIGVTKFGVMAFAAAILGPAGEV